MLTDNNQYIPIKQGNSTQNHCTWKLQRGHHSCTHCTGSSSSWCAVLLITGRDCRCIVSPILFTWSLCHNCLVIVTSSANRLWHHYRGKLTLAHASTFLSWASKKLAWASEILYTTYKGHLFSGECSKNLISHTALAEYKPGEWHNEVAV